ncbi:hypothetical protein EMPG_14879 [Blastomyces silverae]|uniref:Uncharacterized protein n=1 Tax=Blastomyces silverae TaxID=2060906 RepID=A0A0H1BKJ8_9EURO|nr:hypothetical protein EMPG_14879 [Blastomyces silverae]
MSTLVLVKKLRTGVRDGLVVSTDGTRELTRLSKQFVRRSYLGRAWAILGSDMANARSRSRSREHF